MQTDRLTVRKAETNTHRQSQKQRHVETDMETDRLTGKKQTESDMPRQTNRQAKIQQN